MSRSARNPGSAVPTTADPLPVRARVAARLNQRADLLDEDGHLHRVQLQRRTGDLVCGDRVETDGHRILRREPRRNALVRRDGYGRRKTIAAEVDRVWIVVAAEPAPARFLIDRFLVAIHNLPAEPRLLFNKCELDPGGAQRLDRQYGHLGLHALPVSVHEGTGLDALAAAAEGGSNILVGQSGTGKSSLIDALLRRTGNAPEQALQTATLGQTGEGRHTTTTARWYPLAGDGAWIDSPGVRDFTPELDDADTLDRGFPDIAERARECRFRDCRHAAEPGCAVGAAVAAGELPQERLEAWQELRAETRRRD